MFGESASRRQRALLVAGVIFTAGLGVLLAFASRPARAILADTTTTAPATTTDHDNRVGADSRSGARACTSAETRAEDEDNAGAEGADAKADVPSARDHAGATGPTMPSAPVRGSATATPKPQKVQRVASIARVKRKVAPPAAAATKVAPPVTTATKVAPPVTTATNSLEPPKIGAAGAPLERTALASPATSGNVARIFLLAGFALGALLVTVAVVIPAGATRFTLPGGRAVIEHHVDLALLGIALAVLTGLVYALDTAGL